MKKWQWAVLAVAFLLILYVFFKSSREGFEDFKCPDGSTFSAMHSACLTPTSDAPTCSSGFTETDGYCDKQHPGGPTETGPMQCPSGQVFERGKCNTRGPATCTGGQILVIELMNGIPKCVGSRSEMYKADVPTGPPATSTGQAPPKPCKSDDLFVMIGGLPMGDPDTLQCLMKNPTTAPVPGSGGQAVFTGNTTGGSSDTSLGSTSGGGGDRRKQIFGPLFTSRGEGAGSGASSGNSTKDNIYPELLGGGVPKKSTRIDGAGIVAPSKNSDTTGLPSSAGLGSDENSKYFPTSRVPGDMDLIPDPYRVSQTFSASNYSVKNEPVPFLTDFSAFQK
jgi:hypothetical protein